MKKTILLSTLIISIKVLAPTYTIEMQNKRTETIQKVRSNQLLYENCISHIKKSEGFVNQMYLCPANYPTIGYGHRLTKTDNFTFLSEIQADSLLRLDFNKRFKKTNEKLSYNKRLAITCFIFNVGFYKYKKSKLYQLIKSNKYIDNELIKWSHYRSNGKLIKSKNLLTARKFELKLYNYEKLQNNY